MSGGGKNGSGNGSDCGAKDGAGCGAKDGSANESNICVEETLKSQMIYEGKILNLRKDEVTVKDGKTSMREIVEHRGAVAVLAITDENKVVLVRQFRKAAESAVLEIPAGKIEIGEESEAGAREAALRELREETGYRAGKIELISSFYPAIGYSTEMIHLYLATDLTPGDTDFDDNESIDILEYEPEILLKMVREQNICDAKTIIAILMLNSLNLLL